MATSTFSPKHPSGRRTVTWLAAFAALFPFERPAPTLAAEPAPPKPGASPVEALRQEHWLRSLPDTITVPVAGSNGLFTTKRLADASVDDVAFAINDLRRTTGRVLQMTNDLQRVVDLARDAGAVGTSNAVATAISAKGSRR